MPSTRRVPARSGSRPRAPRPQHPEPRLAAARRLATAVIGLSLGLQALAISRLLTPPRAWDPSLLPRLGRARLWPFLDYPMFREVHRAGEELAREVAVARLADGRALRFEPGPGERGLEAGALVGALVRDERDRALAVLARLVPSDDFERIETLHVERERLRLGREGFESEGCDLSHRIELRDEGP